MSDIVVPKEKALAICERKSMPPSNHAGENRQSHRISFFTDAGE